MHYLIVTAHPVQSSLTHGVVQRIAAGIAEGSHSVEIADLAAEGFDPRFSTDDISAFQLQAPIPVDVLAEQQRIDRADAVILVYPVYWWSMPGQLKGWIDRVFTNGWAYQDGGDGKVKRNCRICGCIWRRLVLPIGAPTTAMAIPARYRPRSITASLIIVVRRW